MWLRVQARTTPHIGLNLKKNRDSNYRQFLPSNVETIVVYLLVLAREGSMGPVVIARAAIRYFHLKLSSSSSPTDNL